VNSEDKKTSKMEFCGWPKEGWGGRGTEKGDSPEAWVKDTAIGG